MIDDKVIDDMIQESQVSHESIDMKSLADEIKSICESANNVEPDQDEKVQRILNKLISEEELAYETYVGSLAAIASDELAKINKIFVKIADDELNDHCKNLFMWAKANGYSIPFRHRDYQKFASKKSYDILDTMKAKKTADYYINLAIDSEGDAIKSYENALKYRDLPYDLHTLLIAILNDEKSHLEELHTLKAAVDAESTLYLY